jgi:hypothetical protein
LFAHSDILFLLIPSPLNVKHIKVAEIVISIFSFLVSFSLNIHVVGCATTKEDGGQFHYPLYSFKANLGGYMGPPSAGVTGEAKDNK